MNRPKHFGSVRRLSIRISVGFVFYTISSYGYTLCSFYFQWRETRNAVIIASMKVKNATKALRAAVAARRTSGFDSDPRRVGKVTFMEECVEDAFQTETELEEGRVSAAQGYGSPWIYGRYAQRAFFIIAFTCWCLRYIQ